MKALLLVAGLVFQVAPLDEVLLGMEAGSPPPAPVPAELAAEAVTRIETETEPARLERLLELVRDEREAGPLARALVKVVAAGGDALPIAARALGESPRGHLPRTVPGPAVDRLLELVDAPDAAGAAAARLVGRWAPPDRLRLLLEGWAGDAARTQHVTGLLGELPANAAPAEELLRLLHELDGAGLEPCARPLGAAAFDLARRDDAAAEAALALAATGSGPCGALLHGLGGVGLASPERWERARVILFDHLEARLTLPPATLAAAVRGATALLLDELLPMLQPLAMESRAPAVRLAAVEAHAQLGYRDQPTIDRLIALVEDGDADVARAALEVLRLKTGQRLPGRKAVWQSWRGTAQLPAEPPEGAAAWLCATREARAEQERKAQEEAREVTQRRKTLEEARRRVEEGGKGRAEGSPRRRR